MKTNLLPAITVETQTPVKYSVIILHGLGADGHDFVPVAQAMRFPPELGGIRFVFPHAPVRPITINNGYQMRAWYDIQSLIGQDRGDMQGVLDSIEAINTLIDQEISNGVPSERIFLAGFSQGAAMTLSMALVYPKRLAGFIALSGYLPVSLEKLTLSTANHTSPIFMAHGQADEIVPYLAGRAAYTSLQKIGYQIDWQEYVMGHSVCNEEIHDIQEWIKRVINS